MLFPVWMYKDGQGRIFNTQEELDAAGPGYTDSPAHPYVAPVPEPVKTPEPPPAPPQPALDLEHMNFQELRKLAAEKNLEGWINMKKDALIQLIKKAG